MLGEWGVGRGCRGWGEWAHSYNMVVTEGQTLRISAGCHQLIEYCNVMGLLVSFPLMKLSRISVAGYHSF